MHNFVMGKMQRMNLLAKNGTLLFWGLIAVIGVFACPSGAHAAIGTTTQNWPATPIYGNVAYPSAAITYNAVAGNNRLLVVGISSSTTQVAQAQPTVTYGGTSMTHAIGYSATATKQHSYLFYLPIGSAAVADTGKTINVSISGGTSNYCVVNAAVYTGVDQVSPVATPVRSSNNTTVSTAVGPFTLAVSSGERGISVLNAVLDTYKKAVPTAGNAPTITIGTTGHLWSTVSTVASARMINALRTTFATTINTNTTTATEHLSSDITLNSTAAITIKPVVGITVSNGSSVAGNKAVYVNDGANSTNVVVDAFAITADSALTVNSITFTSNANTTSDKVSGIKIWRKVGPTLTAWEASDVQLGATATATGGAVTISGLSEPVSPAVQNYIVTYDIASNAPASSTTPLTGTITAISPSAISLTDTVALSATVYIYPTLTLGTGTEPAAARLWKSSPATRLDAFTLGLNSPTDSDTVTNLTIRMTPKYITGGSGGTISKFKPTGGIIVTDSSAVTVSTAEVVCSTTGSPDGFDTCTIATNIPVTGTSATYYVAVSTADVITPSVTDTSGTTSGYYVFGGTVTALSHANSNSRLSLGDSTSQSLVIDVEKPAGPATATASTGSSGGQIDLVWDSAVDANGGALAPVPFVIMRGLTQPGPGCIDGTDISTVPGVSINYSGRTATDVGLVDTTPTRYYYRICAKDTLGNLSDGAATYANSAVTSDCNNPPTVTLTGEDGLAISQIIKSADSAPFRLTIANNDIGTCPDVNFTVNLANEMADKISGTYTPDIAHFDKNIAGSPFPGTVTVGRGLPGAPIARSVNIYITGNAQANQLEKYIFSVNVTEPNHNNGLPGDYSFTTPQVTGLLNDMPPIVHNSSNMAKTTYGTWGETFTCATCHSNSTTNIKGVFQIISTEYSGRKNVVFTKISAVSTDYDGVMGNDKRPNKNEANYVCAVCHHRTTQHQYSASKVSGNYLVGEELMGIVGPTGTSAYNDDHHNSRDCVKCHTHNTAFRSILGVCGDCHGNKTTGYSPINQSTMVKDVTMALGPSPFNYGAHARHNTAKITCAACHSNTNHGLSVDVWQGDNLMEMGFLTNKDTFPGFNPNRTISGGTFYGTDALNPPFVWTAGADTTINLVPDTNAACSTYCHGAWAGNVGNNTTPIWVAADQAECGACHYGTGAVPPTSGNHAKHSGNTGAGLGIACNKCHATYANYTGSAHINGNVEWKFDTAYPGATYKTANQGSTNEPAPSASFGTCSNLYCHSTVQGADGTGPPIYKDVVWGGTVTCGSCHADPNTSGSHPSHEDAVAAFDCHVCHNTGGTTSPLNHANGTIDFQFTGLGQNTVYSGGTAVSPGTGYGTCSAGNCHGRFTRAWGTEGTALTLCDKCHGSATSPGGFYNTRGPDGTLSIYSAAIGVHDIHLQNPYSPRKATFARFTSFAAGFSCRQCHAMPTGPFSPGHIDNPLPAETPFSHMSSLANTGETKFSYYSTPSYSIGTQSCSAVWCHGAGMNSNNSTGPYAGVPGAIQRTNPVWNVPFLTGSGANDCSKCHAMPPPAPDANYIHYGATQAKCKDCHVHLTDDGYGFKNKSLHINGTIDGGCDKCHGYPPINNIVGDSQGLATPAQGALQLGTAGAHNAHVLNPNIGKSCETCHYNYNRIMTSDGSGKLEIGFNAYNGTVTSGTFSGYSNSGVHPQWFATNAGTIITEATTGANVCSNLYCHGGGAATASPARPLLGGGTNMAPNWENGSADTVCGSCHGADTSAVPDGGSHAKHALATGGGPAILCSVCHKNSTDMTHVDGAVSWKLDTDNPLIGREGAAYNGISSGRIAGLAPRGTVAVGDDYRNCTNVYCHSNVQGANGVGAPTTHASVKWGANGTMTCTSCHVDMATDATGTGSHLKHANTGAANMALSCGYCHQDGGSGSVNHADNLIFVNFTSYVSGTYSNNNRTAGSATGYGTCSATFCHGTATSPAWGTPGPLACDSCHGASANTATSPSWSGRHATHYNYSTVPTTYNETLTDYSSDSKYRFNCKHCHDADGSKHSLKPYSSSAYARVFFGLSTNRRGTYVYGAAQGATDNGFKYTAGSCNTSYCHSNGRGGAPLNTTLTWTTAPTAGSNCLYCHDGKKETGTSTLSARHDRHMNPSINASLGLQNGQNCQDCHMKTIAADNVTIINRVKHVSGFVDFSSVHGGPTYYNSTTKVCSNVYCHSNGNVGAAIYVNMTGQKAWGGTTNTANCNFCHGRSNATGTPDYANGGANTVTANLHSGHMAGLTDTTGCSQCHRRTASATIANKFVDYSAGTTHLNGGVNIYFDKSKSFIGTNASANQVGNQVTCSSIICHGSGAPVWGAATTAGQCQKCHGSKSVAFQTYTSPQVAPGVSGGTDTTMTKALATDARVGAHERHLATSALSSAVKCRECHVPVTAINNASHWNYTTATLTFSGRATAYGDSPAASRSAGIIQCSNTNCHSGKSNSGANMAPLWNASGLINESTLSVASCNTCHGFPPKSVGTGGTALSYDHTALADPTAFPVTTCTGCHSNMSDTATTYANIFGDKTLHVNGAINASGGHAFPFPGANHATTAGTTPWATCTGCHTNGSNTTYPVASGTAPDCTSCHLQGLKIPSGTSSCYDCHGASATSAMPNGNTFPNYSGSHNKHVVGQGLACSDCHSTYGGGGTDTTHGFSNAVAHDITFVNVTSTTAQFSFSRTGKGSCSNIACHGSAEWGTKLECDSCHSYDTIGGTWGSTKHLDGATAEGWGAHAAHIDNLKAQFGVTLNAATDSYGGATFNVVCGACHSQLSASHTTNGSSQRLVNFNGSAAYQFGPSAPLYNGASGTPSATTPKTCSNISCHMGLTPRWQ